jgi:DNA helicase-4
MKMQWAPSKWGRVLTGSTDWTMRLVGLELSLIVAGRTYQVSLKNEDEVVAQARI